MQCPVTESSHDEETVGNDNGTQRQTEKYGDDWEVTETDTMTETCDERPGHRMLADDYLIDLCDFSTHYRRRGPSQARHGCWKVGWRRDGE